MFFCIEFRTREGRPSRRGSRARSHVALDAAKRAGALGTQPWRHVDAVIAETRADVPASTATVAYGMNVLLDWEIVVIAA